MAAASIGIGELFRSLFADRLVHGRTRPTPFALNLLTLEEDEITTPAMEEVEVGTVHLAGCGAIGQACVATLREMPVRGTLVAVDHDQIDEGNLQRYVLSSASDVGSAKPDVIQRVMADHPLVVEPVSTAWGKDARTAPGRDTVLSALDSKQGRVELQSGLPRQLFNAWTQPEDLGVSRHQAFGEAPCLACLAWPHQARPSESARIAEALGEHELRVLGYLLGGITVDQPLQQDQLHGTLRLPVPPDADQWLRRSLLDDLIDRYELPQEQRRPLAKLHVSALYRDAVCAGLLMEHRQNRDEEISVPLAHQSALAGIMLATWLIANAIPTLRVLLPDATQARYDVLRGGAQIWPLNRGREPRCFCSDPDFRDAYGERWGEN
ncbi:MAG: ThiF family adenylyltransferase [Solirubrobacterales bacterium]